MCGLLEILGQVFYPEIVSRLPPPQFIYFFFFSLKYKAAMWCLVWSNIIFIYFLNELAFVFLDKCLRILEHGKDRTQDDFRIPRERQPFESEAVPAEAISGENKWVNWIKPSCTVS